MNYILFDNPNRTDLLPFTFIRPVADIRIGILTIREKWEKWLDVKTSTLTEDYLSKKFPLVKGTQNILINGSVCPNEKLVDQVKRLKHNQALVHDDYLIAIHLNEEDIENLESTENIKDIVTDLPHIKVQYLWDIFSKNGEAILEDFELLTKDKESNAVSKTNTLINPENIFIEHGVTMECAVLNATNGPIYIGHDAEIMEGAVIRGPFALGEHSVVKMSAKIYGPTTVGPYCKVGGEISNSVIFGYTNKAHDGFLGNSVLGEWCNIGADSNNSNLKNNYAEVKLWNYPEKKFINTGLQFCGLIMGDHSKCGINTMFNTGTVVGINSSIFGHGFQRNFIPSFSWGSTSTGMTTFEMDKAFEIAERVYQRRGKTFGETEKNILRTIYNLTKEYRFL
jgi:UDP-N-acetylglucosamine diphosphorylase/glucosamine-1-phosphate N-acetyltransferase